MIAPPPVNQARSDGDSESDWDDDDDFGAKKINIRIKPKTNTISASVDELRASVGTWKSLTNVNLSKRSSRRTITDDLQLNIPQVTNNNTMFDQVGNLDNVMSSSRHNQGNVDLSLDKTCNNTFRQDRNTISESVNFVDYDAKPLDPNIFNTIVINNDDDIISPEEPIMMPVEVLPVAFAIQESLEHHKETRIMGRLKMAVPPKLVTMNLSYSQQEMEITLASSVRIDQVELNQEFVRQLERIVYDGKSARLRLLINIKAIQSFVRQNFNNQHQMKYFLLPEILSYQVQLVGPSIDLVSPLKISSFWQCDETATKLRLDIKFTPKDHKLTANMIRDLQICTHIGGGVKSCESKPEALWNPELNQVIWLFSDLDELNQKTNPSMPSCMARFEITNGPSKPMGVKVYFSIPDRTLSGAHIVLDDSNNFHLSKQKYEVRTSKFISDPCSLAI